MGTDISGKKSSPRQNKDGQWVCHKRLMWDVKDRQNNNAPIWWCPECHDTVARKNTGE